MTNRYPGKCTKCGQTVHPETGTCEKVGGKWVTTHTTCPQAETVAIPDDWEAVQAAGSKNVVNRTCCKCGREVGIGDGLCARSSDSKWYTWHTECPAAQTTTRRDRDHMAQYSTSPRSTATWSLHPMDPMAERLS
jgi:hypothetical protein